MASRQEPTPTSDALWARLAAKQSAFAAATRNVLSTDGIGRCGLRLSDLAPLDATFFAGIDRTEAMPASGIRDRLDVSPEDFYAHENPGMIAHRYLAFLSVRGDAEGWTEELLANASRIRDGLHRVQELGDRVAPGFVTKPYGAKESRETSIDEIFGHAVSLFLLGRIFPDSGKQLAARASRICDWMLENDLEYSCPSMDGRKQKLISWAPGACTSFYKIPVIFAVASCWTDRKDVGHLLRATLLRQKELLNESSSSTVWPHVLETMAENIYHWVYGPWIYNELGVLAGEVDWTTALRAIGEFAWGQIETDRNIDRPRNAMACACAALLCEGVCPGTVDAIRLAEFLDRWDLDDLHMGYYPRFPEICRDILSVKDLLQWLEAYWRGVGLRLWAGPGRP